MAEINDLYFSASAGLVGCIIFISLRPHSKQKSKSVFIIDTIGLIIASLFCGIGTFLYMRNFILRFDDYLFIVGVCPMIAGFVMPSILKGVALVLKRFQTNPLGMAKTLLDLWNKK